MGRATEQEAVSQPESPPPAARKLRRNSWSFDRLKSLGGDLTDDLIVLRHLWLSNLVPGKKKSSATHAQRLESFYGPQAAACECGRGCRVGLGLPEQHKQPTSDQYGVPAGGGGQGQPAAACSSASWCAWGPNADVAAPCR